MLYKKFCSRLVLVFSALNVAFISLVHAEQYDLVILNGRVMDPDTAFDKISNVGIKDGKIAVITDQPIQANKTIDAVDHVVAPGFIDTHDHSVMFPFSQKVKLRDGVTTLLELEAGVYPVDRFYDYMKGKSQTNYGASVSTASVREKTFHTDFDSKMGATIDDLTADHKTAFIDGTWSTKSPSDAEYQEITRLLEEGLKQGALGIGNIVGYMPGMTSKEVASAHALAAKYHRATYIHSRFSSQASPTSGILAFQELITSASIYGGGVMFQHFHQQALGLIDEALDLFDVARSKGLSVVGEVYPYNFGNTIVGAEYLKPDKYLRQMGRSYEDIIEISTMKPLTKERYDILVETSPNAMVLFYGATEASMLKALAHPDTTVASDGGPYIIAATGKRAEGWNVSYEDVVGHPRAAGTFAKTLRLTRDKKLMPLMRAIAKITYYPAKFLEENGVDQMANKGRLQIGKDADITIFSAENVKDNSTMKKGALPSTGIPYVIVNGTVVVKDSEVLQGVYPGQPIRQPNLHQSG